MRSTTRNALVTLFTVIVVISAGAMTTAQVPQQVKPDDRVAVVTESADLKAGTEVVAKLSKGQQLTVQAVQGQWVWCVLEVDGQKKTGWILATQVAPAREKRELKTEEGPAPGLLHSANILRPRIGRIEVIVDNSPNDEFMHAVEKYDSTITYARVADESKTRWRKALEIVGLWDQGGQDTLTVKMQFAQSNWATTEGYGGKRVSQGVYITSVANLEISGRKQPITVKFAGGREATAAQWTAITGSLDEQIGVTLGRLAAAGVAPEKIAPKLLEFLSPTGSFTGASVAPTFAEIIKAQGPEPILPFLEHEGYFEHGWAMEAFAGASGTKVVDGLVAALTSQNRTGRASCAKLLGNLRDPRAITPLANALTDKESNVRITAAEALGRIRNARAITPLVNALADKEPDVRIAAALAIGQIGDERGAAALVTALADGDKRVRRAAVTALGKIKDDKAFAGLASALTDEDPEVCSSAAASLEKIDPNWTRGQAAAKVVPKLTAALRGWHETENAIRILGKIGDRSAIKPIVLAWATRGSQIAEESLKAIDPEWETHENTRDAVPELLEMLRRDRPSSTERDHCLRVITVLECIGDKRAVGALVSLLADTWNEVRRAALLGLQKIDPNWRKSEAASQEVDPLIALLKQGPVYRRYVAAWALGEIGSPRALESLLAALKDREKHGSDSAAESAAIALGKSGNQRAVDSMLPLLEEKDMRFSAIVGLGLLKDPRAVDPLIRVLKTGEEQYMREEAAIALVRIGDERAREPLMEATKSERVTVSTPWRPMEASKMSDRVSDSTIEARIREDPETLNRWQGWLKPAAPNSSPRAPDPGTKDEPKSRR